MKKVLLKKELHLLEDYMNIKLIKTIKKQISISPRDLDWPFPDKFYESIGHTVHGFSFKFKNVANSLSSILNPSNNLINIESNTEQAENNSAEELFSKKKDIEEKKNRI